METIADVSQPFRPIRPSDSYSHLWRLYQWQLTLLGFIPISWLISPYSKKLKDQEMLRSVTCFFLFAGFLMNSVSAGKKCRDERSINGMALQGFVFKKFYVRAFHECDISCERDIRCQSYNFVVGEKSCELNNRTKEARPENFRSDPARFYVTRLKERGMYKSISILKHRGLFLRGESHPL